MGDTPFIQFTTRKKIYMAELETSKAQREAVRRYQEGRHRFVLWFPESVKDQLEKKGISAREVFEFGLKHYGIKVPK
jgi:hypothetical protein